MILKICLLSIQGLGLVKLQPFTVGCFSGLHFLFVIILKGVGNCRKAAGLFVNYGEQLCRV